MPSISNIVRNKHFFALVVFSILFLVVFYPSWMSLAEKWSQMDQGYSHGFMVFALFVYLLGDRIAQIDFKEIQPFYFIIPVLVGLSLLNILSWHADIQLIQWLTLPLLFLGFFVCIYGVSQSKKLLFPIGFLMFAIPIWDYLTLPLQEIAVTITSALLSFVNIPAFIDGLYVSIPQGTFEIAGGCSGLRYLLVILTLSSLHGYLNYSLWRTKVTLITIACVLGLVTNWLRIFFIIVIGYKTDMQSSLIKEHELFGWVLFAIILIPLFFIAQKLPGYFNDEIPEQIKATNGYSDSFKISPYLIAFICTLILPLIIQPTVANVNSQLLTVLPGETIEEPLWINPKYHGVDHSVDQVVDYNGQKLQISIRSYDEQQQEKELVSYNNVNYSKKWKLVDSYKSGGFAFNVLKHRFLDASVLVASRYYISTIKTADSTTAKLLELFKPLMASSRSSVLIMASPCSENCNMAEENIQQFISRESEFINNFH
jgi:exosortase A